MNPNGLTQTLFYDMVADFLPEHQTYQFYQHISLVNVRDVQNLKFKTP